MLSKVGRESRAVSLHQRGMRISEIGMRGHAPAPRLRPAGLRPPRLRPPKCAVCRPQSAAIKPSMALLTGNYRGKRVSFQRHLYSTLYLTCRPTPHLYPLPLPFTWVKSVSYLLAEA
jgi:hypothetical protein